MIDKKSFLKFSTLSCFPLSLVVIYLLGEKARNVPYNLLRKYKETLKILENIFEKFSSVVRFYTEVIFAHLSAFLQMTCLVSLSNQKSLLKIK